MDILQIIYVLIPMILALTVHEYAHAWMAARLGDDTAMRHGRMTLNPIVHIDPIGTLLIPIVGLWSGVPFFGWAKPVPVTPVNFTRKIRMKTGVLLTSLAGPMSNLLFGLVIAIILGIVGPLSIIELLQSKGVGSSLIMLCLYTLMINVGLFFFNLLPIPPLDGSGVLAGFLPDRYIPILDVIARYSFVFFIAILMVGGGFLRTPILGVINLLFSLVGLESIGPILFG
jgi:Zn-dependent protease